MVWFKVDDSLAFHAKAVAAGNAAMGLWVRAGSWCGQQLTDGHVPAHMVTALGNAAQAAALVRVGLWERAEGGFLFHGWNDPGRQPRAEDVERERAERHEAKVRAGRVGGIASAEARRKQKPSSGQADVKQAVADLLQQNEAPTRPDRREGWGEVQGGALRDVPRTTETPSPDEQPPDARCAEHRLTLDPPPCGACARARKAFEQHEAEQTRKAAEAAVAERKLQAEVRAKAAANCGLCDEDGRLESGSVCGHDPAQLERNRRHVAELRQQLSRKDTA